MLGVKVYIRVLVWAGDHSCVNSELRDVSICNMDSNFDICHFMDIRDSSKLR